MARVWLQFPVLALQEAMEVALKERGLEVVPHPFQAQAGLVGPDGEVPPFPPLPSLLLLKDRDQARQALKRGCRGHLCPVDVE